MSRRIEHSIERLTTSAERNGEVETSKFSNAQKRALTAAIAGDKRFKVLYLIPHLPQDLEKASLFNWYTPGLHSAADLLLLASKLPADVREPYSAPSTVLLMRMTRNVWPSILPIQLDSLVDAMKILGHLFQVVLTNEAVVAEEVDQIVSSSVLPILHVSTIRGNGRVSAHEFDTKEMCKYLLGVIAALVREPVTAEIGKLLRQTIGNATQVKPLKHHLKLGLHNIVRPNEYALMAFGRKLTREKRISMPFFQTSPTEPQVYVDRVCESADAVFAERERLLQDLPEMRDYRYVLAVSSMYWGHYAKWRENVQAAPKKMRSSLRAVFSAAIQATTYFDLVELGKDQKNAPLFLMLARERAADMNSFTAAVTLIATATLAPVLRLEPKLNQIRGEVRLLAHCVRAGVHNSFAWKTSRMVLALGKKMRALINPSFLDRIDALEKEGFIEGMKLVSDLPLELLPVRGLPLAMRYDCSRISPIPGNLFVHACSIPPVQLTLESFKEVLVLRSFKANDMLSSMFEDAVNTISNEQQIFKTKYKFVDVQTVDDVVSGLSNYRGAMVIFDCHGTFDKELGMGSLVIGDEKLSFWNLKGKCSLPPIVMFSACDTQPFDGGHSSVATSAFSLGAVTVLATMLPIYGNRAAMFNARMLYRLEAFLPVVLKSRPTVSWREIVSGMLRMSHATEIMDALMKHAGLKLSLQQWRQAQMRANVTINSNDPRWYEEFLATLAQVSSQTVEQLILEISRNAGFTDAMKYVQLGSPENIIFRRTDLFEPNRS